MCARYSSRKYSMLDVTGEVAPSPRAQNARPKMLSHISSSVSRSSSVPPPASICREGTYWMRLVLRRIEAGGGTEEDLDTLLDMCDNILGRAFCALGDGATSPVTSSIEYFRDEYRAHITEGGCPFDHSKSALFSYTPRTTSQVAGSDQLAGTVGE